ncbi:uncharacterized protein BDZ83DRAFT_658093 [Colletotrichum acutatum]|uniref:Uncharacterized protein n=1 Tax=Glomerella acutata TaxID=27357 RepID=A0AAD8X877_GLOAC|nr:uncharacterized protein BDZ83DRAFT_658093 [Colletotrichum acutatum]KAK1705466.1 hypothetical protein BDZ83DRAFT_658093 [Colletotrichum acutatum]
MSPVHIPTILRWPILSRIIAVFPRYLFVFTTKDCLFQYDFASGGVCGIVLGTYLMGRERFALTHVAHVAHVKFAVMAKFLPIPSSHSAASLVHVGGRPLDRRWVWEFVRVSECEERHSSSRTKVVRPSQTALQSRQLSRLVGDKVVPPLRLAYFSFRSVWLYSYTTYEVQTCCSQ